MSDLGELTEPVATPDVPADTAPVDWEARFHAEVQDRIKERERYKPIAKTFEALDESSRGAIVDLMEAAANRDADYIAEWSASTYKNLKGGDLARAIADQQQSGTQGVQAPVPQAAPAPAPAAAQERDAFGRPLPPPPPIDINAEIDRRIAVREQVVQIQGELKSAGYPADSAAGATIIEHARRSGASISDAVAWYEKEVASIVLSKAQAQAQAAGTVPPTAPHGGVPGAAPDGRTSREKAIDRLKNGNRPSM